MIRIERSTNMKVKLIQRLPWLRPIGPINQYAWCLLFVRFRFIIMRQPRAPMTPLIARNRTISMVPRKVLKIKLRCVTRDQLWSPPTLCMREFDSPHVRVPLCMCESHHWVKCAKKHKIGLGVTHYHWVELTRPSWTKSHPRHNKL